MGFLFKSHGGSKITWGFGKAVGCAAFWWGIGGGNGNCRGFFLWGLLEGSILFRTTSSLATGFWFCSRRSPSLATHFSTLVL